MTTVETMLEHYGTKGMKWGQRRAAKKVAKSDSKFEKAALAPQTTFKIYNKAATIANTRVDAINNKPEYKNADFTLPSDLRTKYYKEHEDSFIRALQESADSITSKSGNKKYGIVIDDNGGWNVHVKDVEHADAVLKVRPVLDGTGHILSLEIVENSLSQVDELIENTLEHYGTKGMKWGVRSRGSSVSSGPEAVTTKVVPGRKIKTSGGKGHGPADDALKVAVIKQKAKKSSTDSLTNQEFKQLVERMNLEQQYSKLSQSQQSAGSKFVRELLMNFGKQKATQALNDAAKKAS